MKNLIAVLTAATMAATAHAEPLEYAHSFFGHVGAEKVGLAISIQGGEVLVGIPHWGSPGPKKATLYNAATRGVIRTFDAPVDKWYGDFGRRVALGANQVLVCGDSYGDGSNEDRPIFLYDRSTGELTTRIPNPHADQWNGTGFGDDCVFDGAQVLVGAARYDGTFRDEGVAYLFDATTGERIHTFRPPTPMSNIVFGKDVALGDKYVAIAQSMIGGKLGDPGAVHLFDRVSGDLVHTFTRPKASQGLFGTSVHIGSGKILIGSVFDSFAGNETGLTFLFDLETKEELMRLAAPPEHENTSFGGDVAIFGDFALIGANDVAVKGENAGAAYLFHLGTGNLEQVLFGPDPEDGAYFGSAVDLGSNGAVIGAYENSMLHYRGGAVHYFRPVDGALQ